MINKLAFVATTFAFLQLASPVSADLPTRSELLKANYDEERTKGLIALNRRYIDDFDKELRALTQAAKLDEATALQQHINSLKAEIEKLEQDRAKAKSMSGKETEEDNASLLVGKSIGYPASEDPAVLYYFSFQKDGAALWLGTKNQSVERQYEPTGTARQIAVWWPARPELGKTIITVAEDGKTAEVVSPRGGKTTTGIIERTR